MKGAKSKSQSKSPSLSVNKKAGVSKLAKPIKKGPIKKGKATKDPNMPKKPAGAFFVFMEDFRPQYKAKHPQNKVVSVVGKAGGDKWKSMSDAEKVPYVVRAGKRKVEYVKNMNAYNKKQSEASKEEEEESEKSSEVNNKDKNEDDDEESMSEEDESE